MRKRNPKDMTALTQAGSRAALEDQESDPSEKGFDEAMLATDKQQPPVTMNDDDIETLKKLLEWDNVPCGLALLTIKAGDVDPRQGAISVVDCATSFPSLVRFRNKEDVLMAKTKEAIIEWVKERRSAEEQGVTDMA